MSNLYDYGTGYAESEALVDVLNVFNSWSGGDELPDFTSLTQRLREHFDEKALRDFEVALITLKQFVQAELLTRRHYAGE